MTDNSKIIYLHGSDSSSQSGKARQFAQLFPGMVTPDFTGSFHERMEQLYSILGDKKDWVIIGSSYGGLMGTVFTSGSPTQVRKLVLLAPALLRESNGTYLDPMTGERLDYSRKSGDSLQPISVPTIIVHGTEDDVVPLEAVRKIAQTLFTDLTYHVVNDGHRLHKAFEELNWEDILT